MPFALIPAIDIRNGRVVRLTQGDYDRETVYGDDPVAVARGYADEGAEWLHLWTWMRPASAVIRSCHWSSA